MNGFQLKPIGFLNGSTTTNGQTNMELMPLEMEFNDWKCCSRIGRNAGKRNEPARQRENVGFIVALTQSDARKSQMEWYKFSS